MHWDEIGIVLKGKEQAGTVPFPESHHSLLCLKSEISDTEYFFFKSKGNSHVSVTNTGLWKLYLKF